MPRSARHTSLETRTAHLRLKIRRAPHFVKIAKGLRLGYYRGSGCGTWIGRRYRGAGVYDTIGVADDTADADSIKVLDYWQAQEEAGRWAERQRLIEEGMVRAGPYTVADVIKDYLDEIRAEKKPDAVRNAEYTFNAFVLPELGLVLLEKLTPDRLTKWRNKLATAPKSVRSKMNASTQATHATPDDDDARRKRKATANRILTMLKAALNRAFQAGRVASNSAWRKVKPFRKVDEAIRPIRRALMMWVEFAARPGGRPDRLISCCVTVSATQRAISTQCRSKWQPYSLHIRQRTNPAPPWIILRV